MADSAPWGARLREHQVFLKKTACLFFQVVGQHHTAPQPNTVWICKALPPSTNNPKDIIFNSMGQALASWQAVPTLSTLHLSWARICMCPLRMGALGSTNLPWQPSVSEQSYPEGTSDTHRFNGTLLIYHFNPEARNWKKKKRKKTISFQPQTDLSLGHFAKELPYSHHSGREQTLYQ